MSAAATIWAIRGPIVTCRRPRQICLSRALQRSAAARSQLMRVGSWCGLRGRGRGPCLALGFRPRRSRSPLEQAKDPCSRVMNMAESFWDLIGDNRIPMQTEGDIESAIERVSLRLQDLNPVELTQFQDELHRHLFELDREELASIAVMLRDGTLQPQSSDGFLFKRAACVLAGKSAFEGATSSLAEFVRFVEPFANAAESLLYLAPNEYLLKTGEEMGSRSPSYESGSNLAYWSA